MAARNLLTLVAFLVALSGHAWAQQGGAVGTPLPGSFASGERSEARPVDPEDVGKPWDPSLSEIDRVDASIRLRAITGKDKEDCHYGPVERRISEDRRRRLFGETRRMSPAEQFQALLDEPEDPTVPPQSLMILAPYTNPLPTGLVCPKGDVTAQLLEKRRDLLQQGQVPSLQPRAETSQASQAREDQNSAADQTRVLGSRLVVKSYDPNLPELDRIQAIMRNRAAKSLDRLPDCYYGPLQLRIPLGTVVKFVNENPDLDGEQYWGWVNEQIQNSKLPPLTILVRSGTRPDCPAGDIDERLRARRAELLEEKRGQ